MAVTEENIWLLEMQSLVQEIKEELGARTSEGRHLKQAHYHARILLELLYDHEVFLSGEEIIGMD